MPDMKKLTLQGAAKGLFITWLILLVPWLYLAPVSLMALGTTRNADIIVWSIWTYPVAVLKAANIRKWEPAIVSLPCLNVVAFFLSGL
jgi:hypothetical protein